MALDTAPVHAQSRWAARRLLERLHTHGYQVQLILPGGEGADPPPNFDECWANGDAATLRNALRAGRHPPKRENLPPIEAVRGAMRKGLWESLDRLFKAGAGMEYSRFGYGLGKSRAGRDWCRHVIEKGQVTPDHPIRMCLRTQALADEAAMEVGLGDKMPAWKGRGVELEPATATKAVVYYCRRWDELKKLDSLGGNLSRVCKIDAEDGTPLARRAEYDVCPYIKMMETFSNAAGGFFPSNMGFQAKISLPAALRRDPALLIADEQLWDKGLVGFDRDKPLVADPGFLSKLTPPAPRKGQSDEQAAAAFADDKAEIIDPLLKLADRVERLAKGERWSASDFAAWLEGCGIMPADLAPRHLRLMRHTRPVPAEPDMTPELWKTAEANGPFNAKLRAWGRVVLLCDDFARNGLVNGDLECNQIFGADDGSGRPQLQYRRPLTPPFDTAPKLMLQAEASPAIINNLFPDAKPIGDWRAAGKHVLKVQFPFQSASHTWLKKPRNLLNVL